MVRTLETERLVLRLGSAEMIVAEIENRDRFAALLGARVPADWPPPLNDEVSRRWVLGQLEAHPDVGPFAFWYFLLKEPSGLSAIGNGGFKGAPGADGAVEVGYSVMESHQRRGYAPEAVEALVGLAFSDSRVRRVTAQTLPELRPSIRVLEKCGFRFIGAGDDEELTTVLFERLRA